MEKIRSDRISGTMRKLHSMQNENRIDRRKAQSISENGTEAISENILETKVASNAIRLRTVYLCERKKDRIEYPGQYVNCIQCKKWKVHSI